MPEVSVLMPVRDGAGFLEQALDSVLSQTFADLELVVVDDGSSDDTPRILSRYAAADRRVRVLSQAGQGHCAALNAGLAVVAAPLVARLDADDVAVADRLERQVAHLHSHPESVVVGGWAELIDGEGRAFATDRTPATDAAIRAALEDGQSPIYHPAATLRTAALRRLGGYRQAFQPSEDVDLWLRLAEGGTLANLQTVVLRYRVHPGQVSLTQLRTATIGTLAACAAARARRGGAPDPFAAAEALDAPRLRSLGIDAGKIAVAEARYAAWWARTLTQAGAFEEAGALWRAAGAAAAQAPHPRRTGAEILRGRAGTERRRGRRLRGGALAARAAVLDPAPLTRRLSRVRPASVADRPPA